MAGEQSQSSASHSEKSEGHITIRSGVHSRQIPAGKTVGEIRKEFKAMFRIPDDAKGYNGTRMLSDDEVPESGMNLEFSKKAGEKGV